MKLQKALEDKLSVIHDPSLSSLVTTSMSERERCQLISYQFTDSLYNQMISERQKFGLKLTLKNTDDKVWDGGEIQINVINREGEVVKQIK